MKTKPKRHKFTAKELYEVSLKKAIHNGYIMPSWDLAGPTAREQAKAIARYVNRKTLSILLLTLLLTGCASQPNPTPHVIYLPGDVQYSDKE